MKTRIENLATLRGSTALVTQPYGRDLSEVTEWLDRLPRIAEVRMSCLLKAEGLWVTQARPLSVFERESLSLLFYRARFDTEGIGYSLYLNPGSTEQWRDQPRMVQLGELGTIRIEAHW